jgi:GNAT superfamily N-acetyltransferase
MNLAIGSSAEAEWTPCGPDDAGLLGSLNAQLAEDEGAHLIGPPSAYIERMRGWLDQGRYKAAAARRGDDVLAYVLWRDDPDYSDVFVRQFFVSRGHRGAGLGRLLFERAAGQFWRGRPLRLDVYDSNPGGRGLLGETRLRTIQPANAPGTRALIICHDRSSAMPGVLAHVPEAM